MSYKNKTYVMFDADTDIRMYRLMTAWKANDKIDFNFHDAHDLNNLRKTASEETIKRKLRERLNSTKQAILLVGENTKNLYKFVRWEIEVAMSMDIPIIAVNLCKSNSSTERTPPILKNNAYFVSVPFEQSKIKHALDKFPDEYHRKKSEAPSDRSYTWK
ncbi:TIR domain-containing protein [Shewanella sp. ULN5]|uniref:TIR domain-containing protein n=1 Tax=Shewanella sp. ULN5 TaxID=2994678 RepID=UPI00273E75BD|nr:TIR domain-containing protein [Shewanella sp. ULN5]MDP5145844.1 TIR domain-containing protein [Shewanella sp. ULN5]